MERLRFALDVLLIQCLSRKAKGGINDYLETDFDDRVDWYLDECTADDAQERLDQVLHLAFACRAAHI